MFQYIQKEKKKKQGIIIYNKIFETNTIALCGVLLIVIALCRVLLNVIALYTLLVVTKNDIHNKY